MRVIDLAVSICLPPQESEASLSQVACAVKDIRNATWRNRTFTLAVTNRRLFLCVGSQAQFLGERGLALERDTRNLAELLDPRTEFFDGDITVCCGLSGHADGGLLPPMAVVKASSVAMAAAMVAPKAAQEAVLGGWGGRKMCNCVIL